MQNCIFYEKITILHAIYPLLVRFEPALAVPEVAEGVEIVTDDEAYTLGGEGIVDGIVALVVMAIDLAAEVAVEDVLDVEITDEGVAVLERADTVGRIAVAHVAIEEQAIVEQAGGDGEIHLDVGEVATVALEVGA